VDFGALAEISRESSRSRGAIASTRGHVRSPESALRAGDIDKNES
jgi:hypothetical protein